MNFSKPVSAFLCLGFALFLSVACSSREPDTTRNTRGYESIFNGEDLAGWDGDPRFWSVDDGAIVGETSEENQTERNTFLVWQGSEVSDFEVTFDYRFVQVGDELAGNSGFLFRAEQFTDGENPALRWRVRGYQADFAYSIPWATGILHDEGGRSTLARRGTRVLIESDDTETVERFADEDSLMNGYDHTQWNHYYVFANGDTLRGYINGTQFNEVIDKSPEGEESGIVAFQLHTGPPTRVEIRNIQLRHLN